MSSYRPASVSVAGPIIGKKIGLTWQDNRDEIVDYLNRFRNLLYNRYEELRLFENVWQCFCPSSFHNECSSCNPCNRCYLGFTLPREMAGVVQAWQWGYPLRLRSSWREAFTGMAPSGGDHLDVVEVRENFPTERDLRSDGSLQVFAEAYGDNGKQLVIEATNTDNRQVKLEFILEGNGVVSSPAVIKRGRIHNVILPADRCGSITLSNTDGYELSRYAPTENQVPAYKRYKLPARCRGNVLVQGTRQLTEVYFDTDVVEIGDRMVLEFMGTYFKHYESLDEREKRKAEKAMNDAYKQLDGLVSRDDGGKLPQPTIYGHARRALPGYRKHYRGVITK